RLEETHLQMYSELARRCQLTIVAGTCPHPTTPPLALHSAYVIGPDGALLGRQDQTHILRPRWRGHALGNSLVPIRTPAGSIGVLIGEDILFPETARALAGAGADILVHLAAVHEPGTAHAVQIAFQARVIENELYGIECFLVGHIPWLKEREEARGLGTSCIAGPAPITGRVDGIIAGMGSAVEGLLIGELNLEQLHAWWEQSPGSLRQAVQPEIYRAVPLPVRRPAPAAVEAEPTPPAGRILETAQPLPHEALAEERPEEPVPAEEDWKAIADETVSDEEMVRSALEALAKEQEEWERRRDIWD
ncbi:MAG: carbon-nitrogen hydrolase family protein, partial [Anaerolineae bacterium]